MRNKQQSVFLCPSNFQLKEENSVHGSDEEVDDPPEMDSDDDLSDDGRKQIQEEVWTSLIFYLRNCLGCFWDDILNLTVYI